jgi:cytochrome d ubiquinol oxidase subunit II
VVLDGFDLGIGIVFPFFPDERERDLMMNTVAPVWDGNETWLVLGGAGLFAVFPMVYSTVLSALYLPLVFMLACLIFVACRSNARQGEPHEASVGSGVYRRLVRCRFLSGHRAGRIPARHSGRGRQLCGDAFGWLTPFSLLTGLGLVVTYALLGCCWLVAKTEGDLQRRLHRVVWPLTLILLGFIAIVSLWTPLQDPTIANAGSLRVCSIACCRCRSLSPSVRSSCGGRYASGITRRPFVLALALVLLGYLGLLVSLWPYAIPSSMTLWEAAAPRSSQMFTLMGAAVIIAGHHQLYDDGLLGISRQGAS